MTEQEACERLDARVGRLGGALRLTRRDGKLALVVGVYETHDGDWAIKCVGPNSTGDYPFEVRLMSRHSLTPVTWADLTDEERVLVAKLRMGIGDV